MFSRETYPHRKVSKKQTRPSKCRQVGLREPPKLGLVKANTASMKCWPKIRIMSPLNAFSSIVQLSVKQRCECTVPANRSDLAKKSANTRAQTVTIGKIIETRKTHTSI